MSAQGSDRLAKERALAAKGRMVSIVIAVTMVLWLAAISLGPMLGLPGRYAFLFDFAALAGLFWALIVALQIRRAQKSLRSHD